MPKPPRLFVAPRWTTYVVHRDAWIYADGSGTTPYNVTGADDLPTHFARVTKPLGLRLDAHLPALIEFCNQFGLLGYTALAGPRAVVLRHRREIRAGDPIDWALRHSTNIHAILELKKGLQNRRQLEPLLKQLAQTQIPLTAPPWQMGLGLNVPELLRGQTPFDVARQVLPALIEPNLVNITRSVSAELSAEFPFRMRALIDAIYWQLADALGMYRIRRCKCGALFFARDPRQRFCPALPGLRTSRCAKRFYMRATRALERKGRK